VLGSGVSVPLAVTEAQSHEAASEDARSRGAARGTRGGRHGLQVDD